MNKPLFPPKAPRAGKEVHDEAGGPVKCSFNFKIPNDPAAIIDMVRPMIVDAGGTMSGETSNVSFSIPTVVGRFDGVCTVVDPMLVNIAVIDKPDIISCKVIRDQLTKYITQAVVMYREQASGAPTAQIVNGETIHG
jgi:hypothetical protein